LAGNDKRANVRKDNGAIWDERVKEKDKELKEILQSSSFARTLAGGTFEEWSGEDSDY
jgi:hypothetical protein